MREQAPVNLTGWRLDESTCKEDWEYNKVKTHHHLGGYYFIHSNTALINFEIGHHRTHLSSYREDSARDHLLLSKHEKSVMRTTPSEQVD